MSGYISESEIAEMKERWLYLKANHSVKPNSKLSIFIPKRNEGSSSDYLNKFNLDEIDRLMLKLPEKYLTGKIKRKQ